MNYVARNVVNGGPAIDMAALGIDPAAVKQVWTILNEEKLMLKYDDQTGEPIPISLPEVKPIHWRTAFMEDRLHDWSIRDGNLVFYGHSSAKGEISDLLIVTEP